MSEGFVNVLSTRLEVLHSDVTEIKDALKTLSEAITKLALVEERQTQTTQALERCFGAVEKIERRLDALERASAGHTRVARWVDKAVLGAAVIAFIFIAKKAGLM